MARRLAAGGDLVYLSLRKLRQLAIDLDVRTGSFAGEVAVGGEVGIDAGVPSLGRVAAKGSARSTYSDPVAEERALWRQLDAVVRKLGGDRIPSLDRGDDGIREGSWVCFHRPLRFGIGHADGMPKHRALIVVDEKEIGPGELIPRLLLNGPVAHVRDPFADEEERNAPGSRSGSSSDHLFIWLDEARRALEEDPGADLRKFGSEVFKEDLPPRDASTAMEMYGAFAARMALPPLSPRLDHVGMCKGIAQVSFVAADEAHTLVMGSPLYIRVQALPEDRPARWWRRSRSAD